MRNLEVTISPRVDYYFPGITHYFWSIYDHDNDEIIDESHTGYLTRKRAIKEGEKVKKELYR